MYKPLVQFLVDKLVDNPESVDIQEEGGDETTIVKLRVAADDLGKVIGKSGKTARAIRMIVSAAAMKDGKRANFEIEK